MYRCISTLILWLAGCSWLASARAQDIDTSSGVTATDSEIQTLVQQLDSARFSERIRAVRQLEQIGLPALPAVAGAAEHSSVEGQTRAFSVLLAWCGAPESELEAATVEVLERLVDSSSPRSARMARQILELQRERALNELIAFLDQYDARVTVRRNPSGAIQTTTVQVSSTWSGTDEDFDRLQELQNLSWLSVESARIGNRALEAFGKCETLEYLFLGQTRVTSDGLASLRNLKQLKHISLRDLPIGDDALVNLGKLPKLESLGLDGTQLTNAGLEHLKEFPNLKVLWLDGTRVTDEGLVHLKSSPNLTRLFLSRTDAGGHGLKHLAALQQLNYLSLKEVQMTPEGISELAKLTQLQTLGLDNTNVTDEMIARLQGLENLETLWLSKTGVTDAVLAHLEQMPSLRTVYLNDSQVTKEAAEQFRATHSGFSLHH